MRTIVMALLMLLTPLTASADRIRDSIVSQLRAQGFSQIEVSRTLLGRSRVTAESDTLSREIIFNPVTGVILRDYSRSRSGTRPNLISPGRGAQGPTGSSSGGAGGNFSGSSGSGGGGGSSSGSGGGGQTGDDDNGDDDGDDGDDGGDDGGDDDGGDDD